jgi:hypothetical protein
MPTSARRCSPSEFHRTTLLNKTDGLDAAQLAVTVAPSTMTLGGRLKHLALVEHSWFLDIFAGQGLGEPWGAVDCDADPDWDRHGEHYTLRWIVVHMIEEYARHNGHADFLREAIDGSTGI